MCWPRRSSTRAISHSHAISACCSCGRPSTSIRTIPGVDAVSPAITTPDQRGAISPLEIPGTTPTGKWSAGTRACRRRLLPHRRRSTREWTCACRAWTWKAREPVAVVESTLRRRNSSAAPIPSDAWCSFAAVDRDAGGQDTADAVRDRGCGRRHAQRAVCRTRSAAGLLAIHERPPSTHRTILLRTSVNPLLVGGQAPPRGRRRQS